MISTRHAVRCFQGGINRSTSTSTITSTSTSTSARFMRVRRNFASAEANGIKSKSNNVTQNKLIAGSAIVALTSIAFINQSWNQEKNITKLDAATIPTSGDVLMLGPTKEKSTGILFPQLCNSYTLVGTGVRIKWGLIKVYAVGAYMDPIAMAAVKTRPPSEIKNALLDPTYPRTIRIVMARGLSIQKFTDAIMESLEPRMKGHDLQTLQEFKSLNPPIDLVKGAEIEMTIRGDTLLYKNAAGGVGMIRSEVFTKALCDVYFGEDAVSPTLKENVLAGIPKL